ncbi:MAG: amidohydrolase family protein [Acidobacteriaceae bacterium]
MIDAHHHLWQYNDRDYLWMSGAMGTLRRDFLIPDLEAVAQESGVTGTLAVQARQSLAETEWLLELAALHPLLLGVVGWVPLCDARVEAELESLAQNHQLRSVRHVLHDEADDFYMLREDFNRGVGLLQSFGLDYDILIFERHLPQTIAFVDRHPKQVFVVDHIAKPRIRERIVSPWREGITELAKRENVFCKVSGMATEADWGAWTIEQMRPYFDTVLAAFGPRRLMFGSDWPVLTLAGSYRRWVDTFRSFIADLSADEQREISEGTARRAYGI